MAHPVKRSCQCASQCVRCVLRKVKVIIMPSWAKICCVRIGSVVGAKADGGQEGLRWVGGTHPTISHVRDSVNIWRYWHILYIYLSHIHSFPISEKFNISLIGDQEYGRISNNTNIKDHGRSDKTFKYIYKYVQMIILSNPGGNERERSSSPLKAVTALLPPVYICVVSITITL